MFAQALVSQYGPKRVAAVTALSKQQATAASKVAALTNMLVCTLHM